MPHDTTNRITQKIHMINPQRHNSSHSKTLKNIRRAILAFNTNFINSNINTLSHRQMNRQRRQKPEIYRPQQRIKSVPRRRFLERIPYLEGILRKHVLGYRLRVYLDSLAHGDEVRGCVEAGFARETGKCVVAGEDRVYEGAGCAFAFCSDDMDDVEAVEICWVVL